MGMTEFEKVLQRCLRDLEQGVSSVDECLHRYPAYAPQLEPILLTCAYIERARAARLSNAFKARVRVRVVQHMFAHPRKPARSPLMFAHRSSALVRLAVGMAVVLLALIAAGTVYAQSALPGDTLYGWKLASEKAWRAVSPDPVKTDLVIAERRVDELIAVRHDATLYARTRQAYLEVEARLITELTVENEKEILTTLETQIEELNQSGIFLPQPEPDRDQTVPPPLEEPIPTLTPVPTVLIPQVETTNLPEIVPTIDQSLPQEVPTTQELPDIVPTLPELPRVIPTIEIPPPIH
jgi:hypothetical protein